MNSSNLHALIQCEALDTLFSELKHLFSLFDIKVSNTKRKRLVTPSNLLARIMGQQMSMVGRRSGSVKDFLYWLPDNQTDCMNILHLHALIRCEALDSDEIMFIKTLLHKASWPAARPPSSRAPPHPHQTSDPPKLFTNT